MHSLVSKEPLSSGLDGDCVRIRVKVAGVRPHAQVGGLRNASRCYLVIWMIAPQSFELLL